MIEKLKKGDPKKVINNSVSLLKLIVSYSYFYSNDYELEVITRLLLEENPLIEIYCEG